VFRPNSPYSALNRELEARIEARNTISEKSPVQAGNSERPLVAARASSFRNSLSPLPSRAAVETTNKRVKTNNRKKHAKNESPGRV